MIRRNFLKAIAALVATASLKKDAAEESSESVPELTPEIIEDDLFLRLRDNPRTVQGIASEEIYAGDFVYVDQGNICRSYPYSNIVGVAQESAKETHAITI